MLVDSLPRVIRRSVPLLPSSRLLIDIGIAALLKAASATRSSTRVSPSARRALSSSLKSVNIFGVANEILREREPTVKARRTIEFASELDALDRSQTRLVPFIESGVVEIPNEPSRSDKPVLVLPKANPTARQSGVTPLVWLLHSIAHIEINAIELSLDTLLRFHDANLPDEFLYDFMSIANDEARHFEFLNERLTAHGSFYGHIPAHDGLWSVAHKTKDDLLGRIAAIQLVQEPRALDSAERLEKKMVSFGDLKSAKLVNVICQEEIEHVRIGVKWFQRLCEARGLDLLPTFHEKVRQYVGIVPPPFNEKARSKANMSSDWYMPIALASSHNSRAPLPVAPTE